jgi:hypothetical protein
LALPDIRLQHQDANAKVQHRAQNGNRLAALSVPSSIPSQAPLPPAQAQAPAPPAQALSILPQVPSVDAIPGPLDGPATKLCSYPISIHPLIEHAKLVAQCNCASVNPFIARSEFFDQSVEYFNEVLAETVNVPQGMYNLD